MMAGCSLSAIDSQRLASQDDQPTAASASIAPTKVAAKRTVD